MIKQKTSLLRLIRFFGIIFIIGVGVSIVTIDVISSYRDFNYRADQMRSAYITRQKQVIRKEVDRVVKVIYYQKAQSDVLTKTKIKSRVYEAYSIAQNIYNQNKTTKTEAEIQEMILTALRPIRFENGIGYYFATRFNGIEVLFADKPEMEGLNLLNVQDVRGKYIIKDMIKIVKQDGEGFYEYHWTKPKVEGNNYKKISYVKRFEPYDWFIGAGLYVDDIESQIKLELLSTISRIRYGKEGYVFINSLNGDALVGNGKVISGGKKLWEVFNKNPEKTKQIFDLEYDAAIKPEGDYIYYSIVKLTNQNSESSKTSFIYGIPEWQWLIGAGVYLDDIETDIAVLHLDLTNQIKTKAFQFLMIVVGIVCFFLFLFSRFNRMLKNDFNLFLLFFNSASFSDKTIDRDLVQFEELDKMAENANKMLQDRKHVEWELRLKEERYRTLEANMPGICYRSVHGEYWTMESISDKIEGLSGYPVSDFIGNSMRSYVSIIHPEDRQMVKDIVKQRTSLKKPFIIEYRIIRSDGELRWVFEKGQGLYNDDGRLVFIDGVLIDLTDRRLAEEKMIEVQSFNEEIIAKSPIGISIYESTGQCISANESIAKLIGTTKEQILLQDFTQIDSWKQTGLIELATSALSKNVTQRMEIDTKSSFGQDVLLDCQLVPLMVGRRKKLLLMATDMTEHIKMQEMIIQSEKILSVGGLAAGMAHEINNPLSGMLQTAEVMNKRLINIDIQANRSVAEKIGIDMEDIKNFMKQRGILRMLTTINESGLRIAEIVNNMLNFSRKSEAKATSEDLTDLIDKALELAETDYDLKKQYDFKTIEVVKKYEENLPLVVCEKTKIQQVLLNIFRNGAQAMHGMKSGSPQFIVRARCEDNKKMFVIEIEDNGLGMNEEMRKRVFEPFFTTKPVGVGTGLGLSVSYFIITQNHNGELTVESQPGIGSKFIIRIPVSVEST